jgi:hypothetical protein
VRLTVRCLPWVVLSLALTVASTPAGAAPARITGRLSQPGYTVIALAPNGRATSARANLSFSLVPPAKRVTLHLRARDGNYAGPIVLASRKRGKRAIVGVRAGAKLGNVEVRAGYAKVPKKRARKWGFAKRWAQARNGVPIGVGNFGRVRSLRADGGPSGDHDLDGVPDPLDIDDDGDLVLDSFESSSGARAAQSGPTSLPTTALGSDLTLGLDQTANVDAGASTTDETDARLAEHGRLAIVIAAGDSTELDCGGSVNPSPPPPLVGGLNYCSYGGTGKLFSPPMSAFPECCDDDQDGFGTLVPSFPGTMFLSHGATSTQIGTGNVLIERGTTGGTESQFAATLQFVFATVPALVSYSDAAGHSATVSYPVDANGPGTRNNGFLVAAGPGGDVVLTVTLWRPQRRRIDGDPGVGEWIDIGGLRYTVLAGGGGDCPPSAFSTDDPNLTPAPATQFHGGGVEDLAADEPADAANTFTYKLNVTNCLASKGRSWSSGETQELSFFGYTGDTGQENAQQPVFFKLE